MAEESSETNWNDTGQGTPPFSAMLMAEEVADDEYEDDDNVGGGDLRADELEDIMNDKDNDELLDLRVPTHLNSHQAVASRASVKSYPVGELHQQYCDHLLAKLPSTESMAEVTTTANQPNYLIQQRILIEAEQLELVLSVQPRGKFDFYIRCIL